MKIFAPWNLLWLVPLVPIIVFFYLLKLKRREVVISSVLLWNHLVKDVQANAPFQKLKKNLLLLLQLLIAVLAIFALARPAFFSNALGGSHVVVILDGSASMQSRDAGGTRFEEARALAQRMVGNMRGGDRMMVLLATSRTHRLTGFTSDKNELRRALAAAEPRETTTNLRDAILLAVSVAGSGVQHQGSRIYVISDGAFEEMEALDTRGSEVQFVKVGTRSDNAGIVAMDVRRALRDQSGYQMFLAVRNYSPAARKCNIEFYRNDALIDVRPLELPPRNEAEGFAEKAEVFDNIRETTGVLRVRLDLKDDLDADNEAYSQLSPRRDINVLLVTDGNMYLEKALNLDPYVKLSTVTPAAYAGQGGFDVVVFENSGPQKPGPGNHLYINCLGATAPVEIRAGKVTDATIVDWERSHPVMRYVKLNQLHIPEAFQVTEKPWAVKLAEHSGGAAIAIGEHAGMKSAFVGFPLLRTEFPLRVAFPIFFGNLIQWLAQSPAAVEGVQLRAGQTAPVEVPATVKQVTVTDPDGRKHKLAPEGRLVYISETERKGIYSVEAPGFKHEFAVNLLSREESATQPKDKLQFGRRPVLAGSGSVRTAREVWRWLLLLALLVLGLEWWVYHRRI